MFTIFKLQFTSNYTFNLYARFDRVITVRLGLSYVFLNYSKSFVEEK